jgi:anti-sigma B factor antagonist
MTLRENKPMNFSIKTSEQENIAILELEGEINMYASPDFRDKLLLVCNEVMQEVIVDFSQVTFMDSSGVATLVEGLKWSKRSEKSFVLKNVGANVKNSLALTKLDTVFKILPSAGEVECFH